MVVYTSPTTLPIDLHKRSLMLNTIMIFITEVWSGLCKLTSKEFWPNSTRPYLVRSITSMAVFSLILCFFAQRRRVILHTNTVVLTGPAQSPMEGEGQFVGPMISMRPNCDDQFAPSPTVHPHLSHRGWW